MNEKTDDIIKKASEILKDRPETRDDTNLHLFEYYAKFSPSHQIRSIFSSMLYKHKNTIKNMDKATSINRSRAFIQNVERRYRPQTETAIKRLEQETQMRIKYASLSDFVDEGYV